MAGLFQTSPDAWGHDGFWNPSAAFIDLTPATPRAKTFLDTVNPLKLFGLGTPNATPVAAGDANPAGTNSGGTATPANAAVGPGTLSVDENWFRRGVIIILGFIFVAVGLGMFKPTIIEAMK